MSFRFVSFHTCFSSRHYSNEWWKSKANHHTICISFIFNWISWMQWIWIQFELHAMSFNIFNQIEFSFHKMNSFPHHFIINYVMFKCFMNMLSFDIILGKTCLSFYVLEKYSTLYIIYDDCVYMWYTSEHIMQIMSKYCYKMFLSIRPWW
jgi:hypothetical protein